MRGSHYGKLGTTDATPEASAWGRIWRSRDDELPPCRVFSPEDFPPDDQDPEAVLYRGIKERFIRATVTQYEYAFLACKLRGMTYDEIAERRQISHERVRQIIQRAERRLRLAVGKAERETRWMNCRLVGWRMLSCIRCGNDFASPPDGISRMCPLCNEERPAMRAAETPPATG